MMRRRPSLLTAALALFAALLVTPAVVTAESSIIVPLQHERGAAIDSIECRLVGAALYADIEQLALAVGGVPTREGENLIVTLPLGRLKFSVGTPFVIVGENGLRQLTLPVVLSRAARDSNGRPVAPAKSLADLLNRYAAGRLTAQETPPAFRATTDSFDIYGVRRDDADDEVKLTIPTRRPVRCEVVGPDSTGLLLKFPQATADVARLRDLASEVGLQLTGIRNDPAGALLELAVGGYSFDRTEEIPPPLPPASGGEEGGSWVIHFRRGVALEAPASPPDLAADRDRWALDVVVIDPGHGGKDPGAIGQGGLKEKDVALDVALRLNYVLKKKGLRTILTRDDDTFIPLVERTSIANRSGGKLFVSLHCNSARKRQARGMETYFLAPTKTARAMAVALLENEVIKYEESRDQYRDLTEENYILLAMAQATFTRESQTLAGLVQELVAGRVGLQDRGVDQAGFYVLIGASMPAILFEMAFISNRDEEKKLKDKKFRQKLADEMGSAVLKFLSDQQAWRPEK